MNEPKYYGLSLCDLCGALVISPEQHTKFHEAIRKGFDVVQDAIVTLADPKSRRRKR